MSEHFRLFDTYYTNENWSIDSIDDNIVVSPHNGITPLINAHFEYEKLDIINMIQPIKLCRIVDPFIYQNAPIN